MISTVWIRLSTTSIERTLQARPPRAATRAPRGCPPRPRPGGARAAGEVGIRPAPADTGRRTSLLREAISANPPSQWRDRATHVRPLADADPIPCDRAPLARRLAHPCRDVVDTATHDVVAVLDAAWALVAATSTLPSSAMKRTKLLHGGVA